MTNDLAIRILTGGILGTTEQTHEAVAMAIKALSALPSAQPGWIPCSERYPDMDEKVLVYTETHDYYVWGCMSNRADNYFWEDEDGFYHDKYEVDLWMPLPEPYGKRRTDD